VDLAAITTSDAFDDDMSDRVDEANENYAIVFGLDTTAKSQFDPIQSHAQRSMKVEILRALGLFAGVWRKR
jgi:hypothetical protein